jgi:rod shape determining protein RodA
LRRRINILEKTDWVTVAIYLMMVLMGWFNIYAAVYNPEMSGIFDLGYRSGKQFVWILFAIVLAIMVMIVDYRFYSYFSYFLYGFTILLLMGVLVFGTEIKGAQSWFVFGGVSLQPSEFVKVTTALALAKLGSSHFYKISEPKWLGVSLGIILLPLLLILLQPDVGSAMVFLAFVFVLYREGFSGIIVFLGFYLILLFILTLVLPSVTVLIISLVVSLALFAFLEKRLTYAMRAFVILATAMLLFYLGNRYVLGQQFPAYQVLLVAVVLCSGFFLYQAKVKKMGNVVVVAAFMVASLFIAHSVSYVFENILEERHRKRINIVLGLEEDPYGAGYNVNQSKIAIGSGGFSGKGYLQGTQTKFKFVPEQTTDFIFCTVGEEWGFLGSFVTIGLFVFLLLRLIFLAERQRSVFSRMFGYAVFSVFLLHFTVNLGMTIGLMPVIGIPLPFFSYGGSSLWAFTIFLFIFIRLDTSRSVYYK